MAGQGFRNLSPDDRRDALEVAERSSSYKAHLLEKDVRIVATFGILFGARSPGTSPSMTARHCRRCGGRSADSPKASTSPTISGRLRRTWFPASATRRFRLRAAGRSAGRGPSASASRNGSGMRPTPLSKEVSPTPDSQRGAEWKRSASTVDPYWIMATFSVSPASWAWTALAPN